MKPKVKRKRIVKPVIQVKPTEPVFKALPKADNTEKVSQDEFITVPVNPDAVTSCDGCHFYDEAEAKCNDTESRDCTGVIFVKE